MEELFFILLKQIEDAGFANGNHSADATHVAANIAIPGTIGLIRQGIKEIMEGIKEVDPKLFEELGGKKTAEKKEKIHTLKPQEKIKKLFDVVEETRAIRGKAEKAGTYHNKCIIPITSIVTTIKTISGACIFFLCTKISAV